MTEDIHAEWARRHLPRCSDGVAGGRHRHRTDSKAAKRSGVRNRSCETRRRNTGHRSLQNRNFQTQTLYQHEKPTPENAAGCIGLEYYTGISAPTSSSSGCTGAELLIVIDLRRTENIANQPSSSVYSVSGTITRRFIVPDTVKTRHIQISYYTRCR